MTHNQDREKIAELYQELQKTMQTQWQRDLPFDELLFDRWERAQRLGFGEHTRIYHNSYVYGTVSVGAHTWIGPYTMLDGTGGLTIGDWCCISAQVQIYTHDTVKKYISGGSLPTEHAPVYIANNCYIGPSAIIAKGVRIGRHSIVGAASFVKQDVPDYTIVAGTPAKIIGKVICNPDGQWELCYHTDKNKTPTT